MQHFSAPAREKILIADSDDNNIRKTREVLQQWGISSDVVSTGLQILHDIHEGAYTLVLMNTELPSMSGIKALRILRADTRYRDLPIIAYLPESSTESPESLMKMGFSAVLAKPFASRELEIELRCVFPPEVFQATPGQPQATAPLQSSTPATAVRQPVAAPKPSTDITEELGRLPGFDCAKGLHRVMGNLGLYTKLLVNFQQALKDCTKEMDEIRAQGDAEAVRALIHKMKGISGNLGADTLYEQTVAFEVLLKQEDFQNCQKELDFFMTSIQKTGKDLETLSFLAPAPAPAAAPQQTRVDSHTENQESMNKEILLLLKEALVLVRQCDTSAREAFDRLMPFFLASRAEELAVIRNAIDSFDFDSAEKDLVKFARTLGPDGEALV